MTAIQILIKIFTVYNGSYVN